ncbi:hypothetical protein PORY_002027 [Pneumocystis oryctolagi]|uniref:Uncharacterized protein n=1 Tax=Pneumocystis oryctolagi TaxID=42067 RepID=A0ACB7CCQ2_9ASCO|nr:hypothetical protein PORY_002027 [Pneumocystis oryctolagi]
MVLLVQTQRIRDALEKYSLLNNEKDVSKYFKSNFIPHHIIIDVSTTLKNISHNIEEKRKSSLNYILKGTYVYHEQKKIQEKTHKQKEMSKIYSIAKEIEYQRLIGENSFYYKNKEPNKYEFQLIKSQICTIINILVSIFSIITAVWIWSKHWTISARVVSAISSGVLIAIAEIFIYNQYLSKVEEKHKLEKKINEKKEIINSIKFEPVKTSFN